MKNTSSNFLILFVFSFFLTSHLLSGQTLAMDNEIPGVKIMKKALAGKFLVDGKGMTLYRYSKDAQNRSNCIEGCAVNWPPFYVGLSAVNEDLETSNFATIIRTDGRNQTTYKGMPLYYFKNDRYSGDTFGHGIGDVWFLVNP